MSLSISVSTSIGLPITISIRILIHILEQISLPIPIQKPKSKPVRPTRRRSEGDYQEKYTLLVLWYVWLQTENDMVHPHNYENTLNI